MIGLDTILLFSAWTAVPFLHWAYIRNTQGIRWTDDEHDPAVWVRRRVVVVAVAVVVVVVGKIV